MDSFRGSKAGFHQKLNLALVGEAGQNAADSRGVFTSQQQPARLREFMLEIHFQLEVVSSLRGRNARLWRADPDSCREVTRSRFRAHGIEHAWLQWWATDNIRFKDGESGSNRNVVSDKGLDKSLNARVVDLDIAERLVGESSVGAIVGFLVGNEFRIYKDAVLKVVYTERDGFGKGDGAKMSGELDVVFVRLLD